ncbi:hypothetical protein AYO21_09136 [Fonsecaea monophora]|uniref:Uncharacterized protein n=1 Tax=Fonsecaea monophora TaxID=254056 RepID=A0A177EZ69_9EURO|nr:hypothetical protein AYO21_09136 [Fonsecaea monophora]OAG36661.1 hypothetical protein AYO21_09136 [Fonsecaea monophora]
MDVGTKESLYADTNLESLANMYKNKSNIWYSVEKVVNKLSAYLTITAKMCNSVVFFCIACGTTNQILHICQHDPMDKPMSEATIKFVVCINSMDKSDAVDTWTGRVRGEWNRICEERFREMLSSRIQGPAQERGPIVGHGLAVVHDEGEQGGHDRELQTLAPRTNPETVSSVRIA